jgi:hypothetical protein
VQSAQRPTSAARDGWAGGSTSQGREDVGERQRADGRGQRAAATRSRCCFERWSWSCSGVGGPRSGCNSSKEGAWPDAGLVGVGPWLLYCSLLLVSLDLFGPGGPLGPPLGPLGRSLRSCSVVPPLCGIPASVSEPLACALDRHWLAEAFDVWSLSASFNHTSLLGPGLAWLWGRKENATAHPHGKGRLFHPRETFHDWPPM